MKLGLKYSAIAIIAVVFLLVSCTGIKTKPVSRLDTIKERGVLIVGIRFDTPPHSFLDQTGKLVGFDVDIANAIARSLGVKLQIVRVDELTRISYLISGNIDVAITSISHTRKRDEAIDFSETYFWSYQTFLVKKGEVTSLSDLVGKLVGMDRGSHAIGNWKSWLINNNYPSQDANIVEFGDKQAAVNAVKQGVIAGWAEDYEILLSYAAQNPDLVVLVGQSIGTKLDGIGLPPNDSILRDTINFALQDIAISGEYNQIYKNWFGPNTNTPIPQEHFIEIWPDG